MLQQVSESQSKTAYVVSDTSNDMIIVHLFDYIAYMARSEEGGDLPIRQLVNGEFHVEGDLLLTSKDRLYMFFKNTPVAVSAGGPQSIILDSPP